MTSALIKQIPPMNNNLSYSTIKYVVSRKIYALAFELEFVHFCHVHTGNFLKIVKSCSGYPKTHKSIKNFYRNNTLFC